MCTFLAQFLVTLLTACARIRITGDSICRFRITWFNDFRQHTQIGTGLVIQFALINRESNKIGCGNLLYDSPSILHVTLSKGFLQTFIFCTHFIQFTAHTFQITVVVMINGLATIPATRLELIGQPDSSRQHAFIETSATLTIKAIVYKHGAYIKVQIKRAAQTEWV